MRIIKTREVTTYHVEFTDEETATLKELGWIPKQVEGPARMWLQEEQVKEWEAILEKNIPYPPS